MSNDFENAVQHYNLRKALCGLLLILALVVTGCQAHLPAAGNPPPMRVRPPLPDLPGTQAYTHILNRSYAAGDILAQHLHRREYALEHPLVAASFVNIDRLMQSSTLGRLLPEYISSRLAQYGFSITELKLRQDSVYVKNDAGEFALTRDLRYLETAREIHAVLVGTYAVSDNFVFISARVIRVHDNMVIAGHDFEIPMDATARALLQ